jgi:hypothetical protein
MSDTARDTGIAALKNGDPRAAVQHLSEAIRANPGDPQAQAYLGAAYGQLGMFSHAAEALARAISLAPQSAALQFNYAVALEKSGKRSEAVAALRTSLVLDPNYDRARQALTRLGEAATAPAPQAEASNVTATGLGEFALGAPPPAPADVTIAGAAYDQTLPASAWSAASAQTVYGAPAPEPEFQAQWTPAPGPQPMGDWTPPPQPAGGLGSYQTAPTGPSLSANEGGTMMATVEAPERSLPRSWKLGHCYLAGLGIGTWWGIVGATIFVLFALTAITALQLGRMLPPVLMIALMIVAIGALLYGLAGWLGGMSEDPEMVCSWLGIGIGVLAALFIMPIALSMLTVGGGGMIGTIIVSRLFGKGLGGKIAEMNTSIFLVAGSGNVEMVRGR